VIPEVPKRWPGETFVCIGGGPSLTTADVDAVHGWARVIAINDAYLLAPWADVLYACDAKWWTWHHGVPSFGGPKYSIESSDPVTFPEVQVLKNTGITGLELDPTGLRTGINSGYQAINLAVHLGASRIVLLGYDMRAVGAHAHFDGYWPARAGAPYNTFLRLFPTIVEPLKTRGIAVINCTPGSALRCFPLKPLQDVLPLEVAA